MKKPSKIIAFTVGAGALLAACGGSDSSWEDDYRTEIRTEQWEVEGPTREQICLMIGTLSDEGLEAELRGQVTDPNGTFLGASHWQEDGNEPTEADYDKAVAMGLELLEDYCG